MYCGEGPCARPFPPEGKGTASGDVREQLQNMMEMG